MPQLSPAASASMLIRSPVSDVYRALTDAQSLTRFWLASASGPLVQGATVHWEFLVPGAVAGPAFVNVLCNPLFSTPVLPPSEGGPQRKATGHTSHRGFLAMHTARPWSINT